ncbi:MAG: oligosaccharide flippase family protein [Weeksellaceae bacterium]|nr:oligosaccharide flippase family protein [Weeksellaceae bacterium]
MFKKLLGETVIYGIGAILPRILIFLLVPVYAMYIDAAEFAKFAQLYALISFVNIFLTFGFETAFFRFSSDESKRDKTFHTSYWFLGATSLVFLLGGLLFHRSIADGLDYAQNPEYIRWFVWIAFFDTLCVIPLAWLRFHNKPLRYTAVRVSQSAVQTLLVLLMFMQIPFENLRVFGLQEQVAIPFFANLLGSIFGFLLLLPVSLKVRRKFDAELFRKMLGYSWPVMLAGFAFMINENFDKTVQRMLISDEMAGAYGGCYKLAVLMTLFVTAFRLGIEPFLFKKMQDKDAPKTYAMITEAFTVLGSVAALAIIVNLGWLKRLFIPNPSYWQAMDIVPIIVFANLFFGIYYTLSTWYKVTDKTRIGFYISLVGAVLTVGLNLLLLPRLGFMVSAYATFIVYMCMMVLSCYIGQRNYPIPYKSRKIIFYLAVSMFIGFISYHLADSNFLIGNGLLILYLGLVYFLERNFILSQIRR